MKSHTIENRTHKLILFLQQQKNPIIHLLNQNLFLCILLCKLKPSKSGTNRFSLKKYTFKFLLFCDVFIFIYYAWSILFNWSSIVYWSRCLVNSFRNYLKLNRRCRWTIQTSKCNLIKLIWANVRQKERTSESKT